MSHYELEELVPVVAKLTEKYTSKESTSVSYEKARQLMEAVIYCIHECEGGNQLVGNEKLQAKDAYEYGYQKLLQKVQQAQDAYSELIVDFNAFGNENYYDTVTKGIIGFFRYYDARFAPQDTILTMDYPTIRPIVRLNGIDAIEKYYTDMSMFYYLKGDIENFVVELCTAEENQRLSRVVAL